MLAGFRRRLEREDEDRLHLAWETAALTGAAMAGKLKPFKHYRQRRNGGRQSPREMLAALRGFQAKGAKMKITRIPLAPSTT